MNNKNTQLDLSIILVNWNTKDLLLDCIKSINNDTKEYKKEIIVVDNASTDGSQEAVKENFPEVKLICNDSNLGFAKGNNIGLKQSKGRYICLVNTDVEILSGCFKTLITYMENNPPVGLSGPQAFNSDRTIQYTCKKVQTLPKTLARAIWIDNIFPGLNYFNHNMSQKADVLAGCFWMVRRKALEQVGYLDEQFFFYGEDRDWCKRFKNAGWGVVYLVKAQIIHYSGSSSSPAPYKYHLQLEKAYFQFWKKHHGKISYIIYYCIRILHQILRILSCSILYLLKPGSRKEYKMKTIRSILCLLWLLGISVIKLD